MTKPAALFDQCRTCLAPVVQPGTGRRRRYCSDPCRQAAYRDRTARAQPEVLAAHAWRDNAALIADVARLGHLRPEWVTLDATFGLGGFWTRWRPQVLIGADLDPAKSRDLRADFLVLPFADGTFDAVVFDPPYKVTGDERGHLAHHYGVEPGLKPSQRRALVADGVVEPGWCGLAMAGLGWRAG